MLFCLAWLFYQDFNEQFEGYTQPFVHVNRKCTCCFIRISMNNLKDIHNVVSSYNFNYLVVLSGFQWTIWRIYTTPLLDMVTVLRLFYQDFNEQFEGYTQPANNHGWLQRSCFIRISMNNLKDIHNTCASCLCSVWLFYQDFNEQFEGYTQPSSSSTHASFGCFIRISMNNLKDIHNQNFCQAAAQLVVLSGFQWTIWRIYTTKASVNMS